ncbi:MAG TPA: cytochrome c biogenesis protein ResB [Pseudonocardiaceae bacterium]|nr:cytochrome c biogenesis protein ResB [Pseudonocardiaceae bacterium]
MGEAIGVLRNTWRGLTSMRTALVLLFLLALAALPGALLPQRSLNASKVDEYRAQHPALGPILERLGAFDVFASPWFAAIYLLLFVSLVGCLVPRTLDYARSARARPVGTPRNLARLPHHRAATVGLTPDEVVETANDRLRGWRVERRVEAGGAHTLSAEKGYLREVGNLVFHFALLALLVAFAVGKLFGYEGQVIVLANGGQFCNSGLLSYDSFRPGLRVDGTDLDPFCVRVDGFTADYDETTGQARSFSADLAYQDAADIEGGRWERSELRVNHPLRLAGDRVYLLGHGYAPIFTVTFPDGQQRTNTIQWRPMDPQTLLSEGATKFDPPGVTDAQQRRERQLAVTGLLAPTAFFDGSLLTSSFAEPRDPAVAVDVLRGDLGNDSGRGQSIFTVDQSMVETGRLVRVARQNLRPGEELTLDDGTRVRFDGVEQWASLQVSHDPAQLWVLVSALLVLAGLGVSLTIKRRRFWVRATPAQGHDLDGRTVVELGGLARTDQAGYGEEFARLATGVTTALDERAETERDARCRST